MRDVMVELTRRMARGVPPPTYRELGDAVGCRRERAWRAVTALEADGWVRRDPARSRDGVIVGRRTQRGLRVMVPWFDLEECLRGPKERT